MNTYKKIIFLIALLPFVGCANWLDLKPENEATNEQLLSDGDGYRTLLNGLYKKMAERDLYGVEMQFGIVDCMSQQYNIQKSTDGSVTLDQIYPSARLFEFNDVDLNPVIESMWLNGYNVICNANNLIHEISMESPSKFELDEMERDLILGEAYACRALMHFDLLRLFAPAPISDDNKNYLPYVETYPDIQANAIAVKPFLEKVIADLETASKLTMHYDTTMMAQCFNASGRARFYREHESGWESYNEVNDFFKSRGYRLNYYAITALQARVLQYMGKHEEAFAAAEKVMKFEAVALNGNRYEMYSRDDFEGFKWESLPDNYKDLKVVSNLIFAVYNEKAYDKYSLGSFFQKKTSDNKKGAWLEFDLYGQGLFRSSQNPDLDESEGDIRAAKLIFKADGWVNISAKWYVSEDLKIRERNVTIVPIIRATEMKYIMAESYAREGKYQEAYAILNQIRIDRSTNWGSLTDLVVKNNFDDFQNDLVNEARREWLGEGQLLYLYKRLNAKVNMGNGDMRPMSRSEYMLPIPSNQNL